MSANLLAKRCQACEGGIPALTPEEVENLLPSVPEWQVTTDGKRLRRHWRVRDFLAALEFLQKVGDLAESEDHHPDLHLTGYRQVVIEIGTHAVNALTENDFILAAKIDRLPVNLKT